MGDSFRREDYAAIEEIIHPLERGHFGYHHYPHHTQGIEHRERVTRMLSSYIDLLPFSHII